MYMVGFYSHEAVKCCYITADGILCIQLVIGFIACRMLSHFMYFVRNDEIKMFNHYNSARYVFIITKWTDWYLEYLLQLEQIQC